MAQTVNGVASVLDLDFSASLPTVLSDGVRRYLPGDPGAGSEQAMICLAEPEPGRPGVFRLIDGVHRAIQMFRNGQHEVSLCVVSA